MLGCTWPGALGSGNAEKCGRKAELLPLGMWEGDVGSLFTGSLMSHLGFGAISLRAQGCDRPPLGLSPTWKGAGRVRSPSDSSWGLQAGEETKALEEASGVLGWEPGALRIADWNTRADREL